MRFLFGGVKGGFGLLAEGAEVGGGERKRGGNGERKWGEGGGVTEAGFEMLAADVADGFSLKTGAFVGFF